MVKSKQCTARRSSTKTPCRRWAILGGNVCQVHGGATKLAKAKAKERIQEAMADVLDPDRSLREAAKMAFVSYGDFLNDDGTPKPRSEWTPHMCAAVKRYRPIKFDQTPGEHGPAGVIGELELWDKPKALEMLFRNLGLFDRDKADVTVQVAIVDRLQAARGRLGGVVDASASPKP